MVGCCGYGNADDTASDFTSLCCFLPAGRRASLLAWHLAPSAAGAVAGAGLAVDRPPLAEAAGQNLDEVWFDGPDGIAALIPEIK